MLPSILHYLPWRFTQQVSGIIFLPKVKQGNFVGNAGGHLETNCLKEKVPSEKGLWKWHPRLQLCTSMAPLINRFCLSHTEEQRRGNGLPTDRSARRSYRLLHTSKIRQNKKAEFISVEIHCIIKLCLQWQLNSPFAFSSFLVKAMIGT